MAQRRAKQRDVRGQPQLEPQVAIGLLEKLRDDGQQILANRPINKDTHSTWKMKAENLLEKAFGENSPNISAVVHAGSIGGAMFDVDETYWEERRAETLTTQLTKLSGLIELLETETGLQSEGVAAFQHRDFGNGIFLVHGHDEAALNLVARYLEKMNHPPIILREQPNRGRTIVEKFEDYADVGFAIVLITPDDRGGTKTSKPEDYSFRARQNVIFELGYFIGRLTRNRVCALYVSGVEIPSDYNGVLFVELDDKGAWKLEVAKEMKAAGLDIDMNLAF